MATTKTKAERAAVREAKQRRKAERLRREAEVARALGERAAQHVVDFLRAAGVDAHASGMQITVAGKAHALPSEAHAAGRPRDEWVDGLVLRRLRDPFPRRVREELRRADVPATTTLTSRGVVVHHGKEALALVRPTHATLGQRIRHDANFLSEGAQYEWLAVRLRRRLGMDTGEAPQEAGRRLPRVLTTGLPDRLAALATGASRRLRTDRALVFGHPVVLRLDRGVLRFEPLRSPPLELPVRYDVRGQRVTGAVRLSAPGDLMPFAVHSGPEALAREAWVLAVVAYAELTCVPVRVAEQPPASARPVAGGRAGARTGRSPADGPRGLTAPDGFQPVGATSRWLATYVAGHRRRLRPGQRATDQAQRHARAVGIQLGPGETWVQPHVRGVPDDAELTFTWRPPAAVTGP